MGDPFDKRRCSFHVPEFATPADEEAWKLSLTAEQRFELLRPVRLARWGEAAMNKPMDRSVMRSMTMDEFRRLNSEEDAAEADWRRAHGWPPRFRTPDDEPHV